jgi:hypothetical protein
MDLFSERARSSASGPHGYQDRVVGVLEKIRAGFVRQGVHGRASVPASYRNPGAAG